MYPCLLILDADKEVRIIKNHVVVNEDKTFSICQEKMEIDCNGKVEMYREVKNDRYRTTASLCYDNKIDASLLISLN